MQEVLDAYCSRLLCEVIGIYLENKIASEYDIADKWILYWVGSLNTCVFKEAVLF